MKIHNLNGNIYIDKELRNKILNIYNNSGDTIAQGDRILFLKDSVFPRASMDLVSEDNIKRCIKPANATTVILGPQPKLSNDAFCYNPIKGEFVPDDQFDEITGEVLYKFFFDQSKSYDTLEQLVDFIENYPDIKYVKDEELHKFVNSGLVIDRTNYLQIMEGIMSKDIDVVKTYFEILNSANLEDSKTYLSYIFWNLVWDNYFHKQANSLQMARFFVSKGINITDNSVTTQDKYVAIFKEEPFLKACFIGKQTEEIEKLIKNNLKTTKIAPENIQLNIS